MGISVSIITSLNTRQILLRSYAVLRAASIFIAVCMSTVAALAETPPPLLPGEVYAKTQNDCGVIFKSGKNPKLSDAEQIKEISESTWTGSCPNGLADGMGRVGKPGDAGEKLDFRWEYAYGRNLLKKSTHHNTTNTVMGYMMGDGRSVNFTDSTDPFSPRWKASAETGAGTELTGPDGDGVRTWKIGCTVDKDKFRGWFSGCDWDNNFTVYGVWVWSKSDLKGATTWCPDPKTSKGCEKLWQEKAGVIIARTKAFVEEVEKKIAEDKRKYAELTQAWIDGAAARKLADQAETKRLATLQAEKKLSDQVEAKQQEALKAAAREKDREIAAQEQQERDEYEAQEKLKAEKAFQASLSKLNAGELFALADKKRNEGDLSKAREILRTLITKFPDNPLVAVAAQQMVQLPTAPEAAVPTLVKPPAPAQTKSSDRDAGLEEMSGAFGGTRK